MERKIKKCAYCGAEFTPHSNNQKYCTPICGVKAYRPDKPPKNCIYCGKEFIPWNKRQVTCGDRKCTNMLSRDGKAKKTYKHRKPANEAIPAKKKKLTAAEWEQLTPSQRWERMTWEELTAELARLHLKYGQAQVLKERGELPADFGKRGNGNG